MRAFSLRAYLEIRHCLSILFFLALVPFRPCCTSPLPTHAHLSMPIIPPSLFLALFRTLDSGFFPSSSFSRADTHGRHTSERARIYSFRFSLSRSFPYDCSGEKRSMRTPRYYVMPVDRGSDILCMLMPHNVGFASLFFSIYLFGSFPLSRFCCERPHHCARISSNSGGGGKIKMVRSDDFESSDEIYIFPSGVIASRGVFSIKYE